MMANFVKLNLVINDAVDGDIAINLDNVPWEEALHIVVMSKGLGKRLLGDILYIAPMGQITEQDEKEALAKKNQPASPQTVVSPRGFEPLLPP